MKSICKKCNTEVLTITFSEEMKLEIWGMVSQDLKLFAVKKLIDEYQYSHKEAKTVITHMNKDFGKCHQCNFSKLEKEYAECPKCKAFNYNLKIDIPFNQEFCSILEYKLQFDELDIDNVKGFWCDGIDHFPTHLKRLTNANIIKNKQIITRAWIGKGGETIYTMIIKLGDNAIKNYLHNDSLIDCIPKDAYKNWISIDPEKKEIEIRLR